jgi:hypothetical protein
VRRRRLLETFALATAFSELACSWGENGLARLEALNPAPDGNAVEVGSSCGLPDRTDGGTPTQPSPSCLGLLGGQWAVRLVQFDNISPLGPPPWNLTITDLFLARLSPDKGSLELTFCGEENALTGSTGIHETIGQNTVPPRTVSAIAKSPLTIPLPHNGTLQASGVVWLWGVHELDHPATDPLPTTADAGTVWDEDDDGHPGVTVDVALPEGQIYLVKRAIFDFSPGSMAAGWVTGTLHAATQQNALGASSPILDTDVPITGRPSCTSIYQLKCVDPGLSCSELVSGYQTMFVGAPNP